MNGLILGILLLACLFAGRVAAEPLTLEQAVDMALAADPRIDEQRANVEAARALIDEVTGNRDPIVDLNLYAGLALRKSGGFFANGSNRCSAGEDCALRDDAYDLDGLTPTFGVELSIIKPLYTFGKIENYEIAARRNLAVEEGRVRLARGQAWLTVQRAWYGYLTASDTLSLLEDIRRRVAEAEQDTRSGVDEGTMKMADLYALQTALALIDRFVAQAEAVREIALDGLKTITGIPRAQPVELADRHIRPVDAGEDALEDLVARALEGRPEMDMAEQGMSAMRAYVAARRAESRPDIYAGAVAVGQLTPGRDRIDNPYLFDPLNFGAVTPVVGMRWNFQSGVDRARVSRAEAELQGVVAKARQAQVGIPFEVAEAYHRIRALRQEIEHLDSGARSARRWMVSGFMDYQAGIMDAGSLADALRTYATTRAEYYSAINDYNMQVATLRHAMGDYP
ncbi:MAG: TolC family protein [Halothiobacillaceae bacterium]